MITPLSMDHKTKKAHLPGDRQEGKKTMEKIIKKIGLYTLKLIEEGHKETKTCPFNDEDRNSQTAEVLTGNVYDLYGVYREDDWGREEECWLQGTLEQCEKFLRLHKDDDEWEE